MVMPKEKFSEIKKKYSTLLVLDEDTAEAFNFVQDMLEAEVDALKERCAYATRTIADIEAAARQVSDMRSEIENDHFGENDETSAKDISKCSEGSAEK